MRNLNYRFQTNLLTGFLLLTIIVQPLMSFTRNPDTLHDAYFFSQGKALNSGLKIHEDIYSPYGPLVPWILSVCMKLFGDYLILGRLLGLFIFISVCLFMYSLLRYKLSIVSSLLFVSLYVSLSPERTEVSSPRWIYGAGIWPTSLAILLTLNLLWMTVRIFDSERQNKMSDSYLIVSSLFSSLLLISRIQGILTFSLFFLGICLCVNSKQIEIRRRSFIVLLGMSFSTLILIVSLWRSGTLSSTFSEMIVAPFNVTASGMSGRWLSWLSALFLSCAASILAFSITILVIRFSIKKLPIMVIVSFFSGITSILFLASSKQDFPVSFNGNPILWSRKVLTWLPSWTPWMVALLCLFVILQAMSNVIQSATHGSKRISYSLNLNVLMIPIGISSFSHLFYNYAYVYLLFPITFIIIIFNLDRISVSALTRKSVKAWSLIQILVFLLVSVIGFQQKTTSYPSGVFEGLRDTREYSYQIQELLSFIESAGIRQSSQLFCDQVIYRYFDVDSYKVDRNFLISPPRDKEFYISRIGDTAKQILVCGENNFFSKADLLKSGWVEKAQKRVISNPSLSIQLLTNSGGG